MTALVLSALLLTQTGAPARAIAKDKPAGATLAGRVTALDTGKPVRAGLGPAPVTLAEGEKKTLSLKLPRRN